MFLFISFFFTHFINQIYYQSCIWRIQKPDKFKTLAMSETKMIYFMEINAFIRYFSLLISKHDKKKSVPLLCMTLSGIEHLCISFYSLAKKPVLKNMTQTRIRIFPYISGQIIYFSPSTNWFLSNSYLKRNKPY